MPPKMVRRIPGAGDPRRFQSAPKNASGTQPRFFMVLGSTLAHFGLPLAPFWLHFGSLLALFGSISAPFGSLLVSKSLKELYGTFPALFLETSPRYNCLLFDFLFFECQHRQYLPAWRIESTPVKARHPRTHRLTWNGRKSWGAAVTLCVFNGFWEPFRHRFFNIFLNG